MLKILHITDLHGHKPFYKWAEEQTEQYDALCISGDLIGSTPSMKRNQLKEEDDYKQRNFVIHWLETITIPVFVCSGNHDIISECIDELTIDLNTFSSSIDDGDSWEGYEDPIDTERCTWLNGFNNKKVYTDNAIQIIKGITFGVVPYNDSQPLSRFSQCDVLIHHEPPAKTPTAIQDGSDWGSSRLYQALIQNEISPSYILCGHVHRPDKNSFNLKNTTISNPGAHFNQSVPKYRTIII